MADDNSVNSGVVILDKKKNHCSFSQTFGQDYSSTVKGIVNKPNKPTFKQRSSKADLTCCVLMCNSNSKKNPKLSYYVIPKDPELTKNGFL